MGEMQQKQFTFCKMLGELIVWAYQQGYSCQIGDAWRSTDKLYVPGGHEGFDDDLQYSYQELLFYNKKSKLTQGKHNDRLAIDFVIYKDGKALTGEEHRPIGEKWESMGGRWGGRFGVKPADYNNKIGWDAGHFEL